MITFIYILLGLIIIIYVLNLHLDNLQLKKEIKSLEHNHNECPHITYIKGIRRGKEIK